MKRVSLEELLKTHSDDSYEQQYKYIMGLLTAGRIKPVQNSKTNGKKPALHLFYWKQEETKTDVEDLEEELKFQLMPLITIDYYLSHLTKYREDRIYVRKLSEYLTDSRELLEQPRSVNERSFEIWNREKFLTKEQGNKILNRCGIKPELLHMYETAEPIAYYSHTRETPQNMLILENKDTFFSMRRHLLDGNDRIFGEKIGTLIYGGGKRIVKSFRDYELSAEPYMKSRENRLYYFGDLDYEGIGIYESLMQQSKEQWKIIPFATAYEKMLEKAAFVEKLPDTKEAQNRNLTGRFFSQFSKATVARMKEILEREQYIPQEILNISDF